MADLTHSRGTPESVDVIHFSKMGEVTATFRFPNIENGEHNATFYTVAQNQKQGETQSASETDWIKRNETKTTSMDKRQILEPMHSLSI